MKCSQLLFGPVSLGVVVLVYLTKTAHCETTTPSEEIENVTVWANTHNLSMTHNLTEGRRVPGDILLCNQTAIQEKNQYYSYVWEHIRWPNPLEKEENYTINMFSVTDKGDLGLVGVNEGGVGYDFVEFYVQGQDDSRYEFDFLIYGHQPKNGT